MPRGPRAVQAREFQGAELEVAAVLFAIGFFSSIAGTVGFVYLPAFAVMATTAALCTPLGVRLARHVNERALKRVFVLFLLASAAAILFA